MSFNMKKLSGALVVAGLVAACGGEEQNAGGAQGDTGRIESREDAPVIIDITTVRNETVSCYQLGFQGYADGFGCYLAANITHQYHTGNSVVFRPMPNHHQHVPGDGFIRYGFLAGDQSLYVGPGNGMVTFKGDTSVSIAGYTLEERMVSSGTLAQDICLKKLDGTKVACSAGYTVGFWAPPNGPSYQGHLYSCTVNTNMTCP